MAMLVFDAKNPTHPNAGSLFSSLPESPVVFFPFVAAQIQKKVVRAYKP